MSVTLIKTTEQYRCDTESEADRIINEAKGDSHFLLAKSTSEYKERKQKGETIDAWYRVTLVKSFDDEKEPCSTTSVEYHTDAGFFPSVDVDDDYEGEE